MKHILAEYNVMSPREFFLDNHGIVKVNGKWITNLRDFCNKVYCNKDLDDDTIEDAMINDTHYAYSSYDDKFVIDFQNWATGDTYGRDNINFSVIGMDDPRWEEYKEQRLTRGYDDSETWNLDSTIIMFMLPRIKTLREVTYGYPGVLDSMEEWEAILNKIIDALELYISTEGECVDYFPLENEDEIKRENKRLNNTRFKEGWELLHKWFFWLND